MGRHDSFDRLAKAMAQVYSDDSADGIFEGGYEEQARRPAFDTLDAEMDTHTRGIINCARRLIAERHGIQPRVLTGTKKDGAE